MDAFFASVEQRDHPELKGKAVAVGGSKQRGVVAAASYEARKYGVRSAMPSVIAFRKCPSITFVKPRFEVYKKVSLQIRAIFSEYTDLIEPLSLDEAYLDVTQNKKAMPYAMDIADEICKKIEHTTQLTASAGVSFNKFLAKTASDVNKPNGLYVITPKMAERFIETLPIERFFGIGKVTAKKMHAKGITNGWQLKQKSKEELKLWFGKVGAYYYDIARGIDERRVNPNRIRKSLGAERTYDIDLTTIAQLSNHLEDIIELLVKRTEKAEVQGKSLSLKVKYADFTQITRSKTLLKNFDIDSIRAVAIELIEDIPNLTKGIRLLGLQLSNFDYNVHDTTLGQLEFDFDVGNKK